MVLNLEAAACVKKDILKVLENFYENNSGEVLF